MSLVKEAYKEIELEKDPNLRKKKMRAERTYERASDEQPFESKRPKNYNPFVNEDNTANQNYEELKFTRAFK